MKVRIPVGGEVDWGHEVLKEFGCSSTTALVVDPQAVDVARTRLKVCCRGAVRLPFPGSLAERG